MLVVAPLRVARQTWTDELKEWDAFEGLTCALLHGKDKDATLKRADADIYLINYEGLPWLCNHYFGRALPFDVIVFDELTRLKNARWPGKSNGGSERAKTLLRHLGNSGPRYRWGLTGSLAGDGNYLDVFGQQLVLDDGAALGRFITKYRDTYFVAGFDGFSYDLRRGAEHEITAKLAPYWFYMDAADYAELPRLVDAPRFGDLSPAERNLYRDMETKFIATLPGGRVEAANAGAAYGKLAQMANGAVYDEGREVLNIHNIKIDLLDDLVEELNGEPLLLGYEFNHDLTRLQAWHKERFGRDLPYLGAGTTPAQETLFKEQWNANKLVVLAAHPASAGHGLNLQKGSARNVCWFSICWSFELYDQFVRRVRRDGNESDVVFNHMLIVRGTIDEDKLAARDVKGFTSAGLIASLNRQILRERREAHAEGELPQNLENEPMASRLSRPAAAPEAPGGANLPPIGAAPQQPAQQQWAAQAPAQQQWGGQQMAPGNPTQGPTPFLQPHEQVGQGQQMPAGWGAPPSQSEADQRARIQGTIAPNPSPAVGGAFSGPAQAQGAAIANGDYGQPAQNAGYAQAPAQTAQAPAATRTRRSKAPEQSQTDNEPDAALLTARVEVLKIAFADASTPLAEGFEVANELWKWVNGG